MAFERGDKVFILDYPFGRPLNMCGRIVGKIGEDFFNVLIENGFREGQIVKYKYWNLILESDLLREEESK